MNLLIYLLLIGHNYNLYYRITKITKFNIKLSNSSSSRKVKSKKLIKIEVKPLIRMKKKATHINIII